VSDGKKVEDLHTALDALMHGVQYLFTDEMRATLVVRHPDDKDACIILTKDDLSEVIETLRYMDGDVEPEGEL